MYRMMQASLIVAIGVFAILPRPAMAQAPDLAAEEQQIRSTIEEWLAAIATKDADAIADFYTKDGAILPPGAPLAEGREAIAEVWAGLVGLEEFSLSFVPTKIDIAASADMASDVGTYSLGYASESGPVRDEGKYVVVWRKVDDTWKAAADIFNSNGALP